MPQSVVSIENNFKNGLITEATGVNFPENAVTETYDCIFNIDGSVKRRRGFDFEANNTTKNINRTDRAISTYLWKNVAGNGDLTVYVVQVGATIYFYKTDSSSLSTGAVVSTVTLTPVSGAPVPDAVEAQFSDGNGYLIVTHPYCEPMRVAFDPDTDIASSTTIILKIRDFEGAIADPESIDSRPSVSLGGLNVNHKYNLLNQGWTAANLTIWDTNQTTMPSNADVMFSFKDSSDNFDATSAAIARVNAGNSKAPNGHYILTLSNQDRDTAAGTSGVVATTTGSQRPSTSAFFAGRAFYSGINYLGFNAKIYFTQIIERTTQYGETYQVNDPSAEDLFDLLPSDGGVINIQEAGTIYKLMTIPGGMAVFAANGVWFITGSTGIGFTANDYTVQKIAEIATLSASSFVSVAGYPAWWNNEGIYTLVVEGNNTIPSVKSLTYTTIKDFYDDIPQSSKIYAKGYFNYIDGVIQWIYRSTGTNQVTNIYEYDRVLNFNLRTNAFYPWTISSSDVKVNGIVVLDSSAGLTSVANVIDGSSNNVVDTSSDQVIAYTTSGIQDAELTSKFLVSFPSGVTYSFTMAEETNPEYIDWFQNDATGIDYTSYFITGYKLKGQGLRKFQLGWTRFFSEVNESVSYYVQGIWNFANTGSGTGRWSTRQYVTHTDTNYSVASRRLKIRGHGTTLQLKVTSASGQPFTMLGWVNLDTVNPAP